MSLQIFKICSVCILIVVNLGDAKQPLAQRAIPFADFREDFVLLNSSIKTISKTTRGYCAQHCLSTPTCLSFNYCKSKKCQLNSLNAFSEGIEFQEASGKCFQPGFLPKENQKSTPEPKQN